MSEQKDEIVIACKYLVAVVLCANSVMRPLHELVVTSPSHELMAVTSSAIGASSEPLGLLSCPRFSSARQFAYAHTVRHTRFRTTCMVEIRQRHTLRCAKDSATAAIKV